MNQLEFYASVCDKIDAIMASNFSTGMTMEGLNSNIVGRIFVSIVDTFGGLLSTFATNLTKFNKSLKRSELHEFVNSNALKTRTVDKLPYDKLIGVLIDCPANMKGTYKDAVSSLTKVYIRLNAINNGKMVATSFREILNSINSFDSKISSQTDSVSSLMTRLVATAKPAVDECLEQFRGQFVKKIPFEKAFLSSEEFVLVRKALIDNEYRLQDVNEMTKTVESMESTLKSITSAVDSNNTDNLVTSKDINNMANIAKSIALIFDAYGMAVQRQMALEHNYVLCVNYLYSSIK